MKQYLKKVTFFLKEHTITVNKYNYKDLKNEVINYCIDDCKSLYKILVKFNQLIFDNFNINQKNYPTIPSIAFF